MPGDRQARYRLDQLVPVKDAVRGLPKLIARLAAGEGPFVLTRRGEPVAVLRVFGGDDD